MIMNEAIRLNNQAVSILQRDAPYYQSEKQTCWLFTRSLTALRTALLQQGADDSSADEEACSSNEALSVRFAETEDGPSLFDRQECLGEVHIHFLYNRMFRLVPCDVTGAKILEAYIACVIFNLALLHQYQTIGMMACQLKSSYLKKAAVLYGSCFRVIQNATTRSRPHQTSMCGTLSATGCLSTEVFLLIQIASLNNLAHVHYECDDYEHAGEHLMRVAALLQTTQDDDHETHKYCFTSIEYEGIIANVFLLKPPTVAVAA